MATAGKRLVVLLYYMIILFAYEYCSEPMWYAAKGTAETGYATDNGMTLLQAFNEAIDLYLSDKGERYAP